MRQSSKFLFVLNLQTARALGIDVPSGVLATADQVINRTQFVALRYVSFWHKADMAIALIDVRFWG